MKIILAILSSSVIASIITSLVTIKVRNKDCMAEYIIRERRIWRNYIRDKSVQFIEEKNENNKIKIMYQFQLRLNPLSTRDKEIIKYMEEIIESKDCDDIDIKNKEFIDGIAKLLKEDWERSKMEVKTSIGSMGKFLFVLYILIIYLIISANLGSICLPNSNTMENKVIYDIVNSIILKVLIVFLSIYLLKFIENKLMSSQIENKFYKKTRNLFKKLKTEHYYRK